MKLSILKTTFFLILAVSFATCSKEESIPVNEQLNGIWQVNSFTLNSIETIDFVVDDMTMEFNAGDNGNGISKWILDGDETIATYQLEDNDTKLTYSDASFLIKVNNQTLLLDGMIDGDDVVIKADKK